MKAIVITVLTMLLSLSGHASNRFAGKELNDDTLMECLKHYDIDNPKWVLAQAKLETGNYKSQHCVKHHNLFGLCNSKKKQYFRYSHWSKSVKAYKEMIQREGRYDKVKYNDKNYGQYLKKIGYAEDPQYIEKLRVIRSKMK